MLTVTNVLRRLPPDVAATLREPVHEVLTVRTGTLLWLGRDRRAVDGDQLRRDDPRHSAPRLWRQILRAVLGISARVDPAHPRRGLAADDRLRRERGADHRSSTSSSNGSRWRRRWRTACGSIAWCRRLTLFGTFYGLFFALTPARYRGRDCRKWPGALFITVLVAGDRRAPAAGRSACSAATLSPTAASPA